ncbi:MAG: ATP-binding cassette domain-containing protein [Deltaproteobacteria bacterium]|nr:ATP-binding cassette domain-containing protein [Candidatus Anaeroferrophillacea bacterium]
MIHVENLTRFYGDFCAVDHLDLDISRGEVVGLLGPNGAGKTTTLRMLTGYLPPSDGDIRVNDFSIRDDLLEIKRLTGYLPESAPLYHNMLVYDYLTYIARIRGLDGDRQRNRIRELAALCGLTHIMHKSIETLSKGLKQRVGLAHAMMSDPEILVLDEPTSGLDPNQIIEIRDIIKEIGREKTVILSTHILSEAEASCDRIVIINNGRIIADDNTADLKGANRGSGLRLILRRAALPDAVDRLAALAGVESVLPENGVAGAGSGEVAELRLRLQSGGDTDIRPAVYAAIKDTDWVLVEMVRETRTLESIFRELTREN